MPPPKSGKKLTARQIELLKTWIDQGAQWSKHWAFEPVRRPAAAGRSRRGLDQKPDRPVRAGPARERGSRPIDSGRADRRLIRRLTLDLIGLPPDARGGRRVSGRRHARRIRGPCRSPAGFAPLRRTDGDGLAGRRPLCRHQRLSERLRPHHVALARLGHRRLQSQSAVRSLRDRADRRRPLAGASLDQRIATGFNRNNRTVTEAGSIDEEYRVENTVDRVETTSMVFLGLTLGCCPLPRPQVRPGFAVRVLSVLWLLQ